MRSREPLPILMVAALALVGCQRGQTDTTQTTTHTETKQVGTTVRSTTETTVATAEGDAKSVAKTFVGTVTVFTPGQKIEVMTGNKELYAFGLAGKNDVVSVDPDIAVGSKVLLVEETGEKGYRKVTVTVAPPA